jgi:predicted NUDIX family NTP pyrophosphohydrolase
MGPKISAGILLYRERTGELEVLLAHPGGPYYAHKDAGDWSIPKGEPTDSELGRSAAKPLAELGRSAAKPLAELDLEAVARREFAEETGQSIGPGPLVSLGTIVQLGGKTIYAWAARGDLDPASAHSNSFELEGPPRSGRRQSFPEVDKVAWFATAEARVKLKAAQIPLLERLEASLAVAHPGN